jgi:hypothetical protein
MKYFALAALLLLMACFSPRPSTSEGWAVRCNRIAEDNLPHNKERFATCVREWSDWLKAGQADSQR